MPRPRQASDHIDELLEEIKDLQRQIVMGPAVTLQDAAVKLRRLSVYLEGQAPARLLGPGRSAPWRGRQSLSRELSSPLPRKCRLSGVERTLWLTTPHVCL